MLLTSFPTQPQMTAADFLKIYSNPLGVWMDDDGKWSPGDRVFFNLVVDRFIKQKVMV